MLFYLVISILILCLLFILFLPNLTAYLLCYILPSLSPSLTLLEISSFSCLPLSCSHFLAHVLFHTTLISVSFESCRVEINLLQPGRGLFLIDIHRLHISVENLQFSDAMASSVSPTEESSSSKLRKFILKLISISIREISFDVKVAKADQLLVSGSAQDFIIVTSSSSSQDSSYVLIEVNIREGELTFAQLGSVFCAYSNEKSVISVDYQVFSRKMIVMGALKGLNRVKVDLEPFIQFYHRFQLEEDDALERKMLITDRLDGKMTFMSVKVDKMSVNLTDNRVPEPLDFELISFAMSIAMHRIPDSPNRNKCITVSLGMARWFHCDAVVMNLQAKKQLFIMNEKDFIDVEIAEGHCDKVSFVSLPSFFLKWLCILSDVNDCLPSSRFAHTKQSTLNVNIAHFLLSYCPISSDPSDSQEEEEESLVCFEHQKLKVRKRSEAYQNESHYSITSQSFQLRSTLSFAELQRRCSLVLAKDESRVPFSGAGSCGTLWIFDEFQATCISGVSFLFKSIKSTSFRVLNVSTLTSSQSIFLQMDPLNASWSSEHQVQVILGEILMTVSVEYLTIFNITFGFINRAVERLLGFLRSMKELKYGPVLRPQSPSLEVKVDSSGLNVQFLTSLPSESSIRFVASSLQYSSLEGRSTYVMLQSRLRLQLSETLSHEVITFEKICYCSHASLASSRRINHSFMTLKTCRFFLLPYASLGTLLSQLGSFSEAVSLSQLLPGEQVQVIPTVYKLELDSFEVLFCQETPEQSPSSSSSLSVKCAAVSRLRLLDISVEHDCSDSNSIVQNDIAKLDQVPGIHYSSPSGGKLRLQCDSIRMFTESAGLEYFLLEKTSVTGVLYSASVEDDRLPTFEVRKTWLPLHSSMLASLNQGIASAGVYKREHNAPSKTYGNLFLTLDKVRVGINPAVALCVNESVEIAGKAFGDDEKKKDNCNSAPPPQIPLSMWDSIRYWYHGSISFLLGSVVVKVISEIKNEDVVPEVASNNLLTRQNSLKTLNKKQIQLVIQLQQVRLTLAYTAIELRAYSLVFNLRHRIRERLENIDLLHMPGIQLLPILKQYLTL